MLVCMHIQRLNLALNRTQADNDNRLAGRCCAFIKQHALSTMASHVHGQPGFQPCKIGSMRVLEACILSAWPGEVHVLLACRILRHVLALPTQEVKSIKVQRFYRPEDISADLGYRAGFWDVYASSEQEEVDVEDVQALCQVRRSGSPTGGPQHTNSWSCTGPQHLLAL